jgi:uncharacterized protein
VARSNSSADKPAHWDGRDLILRVQVQPRASRNEFAGRHGDAFKVRLTAPPVEGRANEALIAFLAETFGVAKNQVALLRGDTARLKQLKIIAPRRWPAGLDLPQKTPA